MVMTERPLSFEASREAPAYEGVGGARSARKVVVFARSPMIEAHELTKDYGTVVAVRQVSFEVGRGEVVGFLGPNGAGKTTTLRMLAGALGPTSGRITINGHDVASEPLLARRSLGYMPEAAPLYPEMRTLEYLAFRARLKGLPGREQKRAVAD